MILEIKKERKGDWSAKYFVGWTKSEFKELIRLTKKAKVKKDGIFYKRDKAMINDMTIAYYRAFMGRFELDKVMIEDERDTVLRMLHSLPAEQFRNFVEITFEPYTNLEDSVSITFEE